MFWQDGDGQSPKCEQPAVQKQASERVKAAGSQASPSQASCGTIQSNEAPTTSRQALCTGPSAPALVSSQSDPPTRRSLRKRVAADGAANHSVASESNIPPDQENSHHNRFLNLPAHFLLSSVCLIFKNIQENCGTMTTFSTLIKHYSTFII